VSSWIWAFGAYWSGRDLFSVAIDFNPKRVKNHRDRESLRLTMPPKAPTKDDRKARLALAWKYFDFLEQASEMENKAAILRAKARKLKETHPMLARMDNLVDNFDRPKRKGKEPAGENPPSKKKTRTGVSKMQGTEKTPQATTPFEFKGMPTVHYHENEEGDKIPCTESHRPE